LFVPLRPGLKYGEVCFVESHFNKTDVVFQHDPTVAIYSQRQARRRHYEQQSDDAVSEQKK
jgi:hypothetical protein